MKVAVVQPNIKLGKKDANVWSISNEVTLLGRREVDIACFPELATTGYALYDKWPDFSEPIPGPTTEKLGKAAREAGMYVVVGMPEKGPGRTIYDSAVLIDPKGEVAGVYRKVHLWDKERVYFTRADSFPTFKTKLGTIGIGICYDIEFPEASRSLALGGAKLLLFPSAEPKWMRRQIDVYAQSRAAENCVFIAYSNLAGREADLIYMGHSQITSPDCKVLAEVAGLRGSAVAEIDLGYLETKKMELPYLVQREPSSYRA